MYSIPNYNPYHPRSTPAPVKLPPIEMVLAAKQRGASLVGQDGETIYRHSGGYWHVTYWTNGEYGSWWRTEGEPPHTVIVL